MTTCKTRGKSLFFAGMCALLACALAASAFCFTASAALSEEPAAQKSKLREPSTGTNTVSDSGATIDISNTSDGYVMIRYSGSGSKIKVQITRGAGTTYTYDLNSSGRFETFPLTAGDGSYTINVFENIHGNKYAMVVGTTTAVTLNSKFSPFLYPSQYVYFTADSTVVKKSAELADGAADQLAVISNIYNYVIKNVSYDTNKAQTVKPGYLPSVDKILSSGKGICFDYAALMAAMLRAQNIPTRLQIGYVSDGLYHAWISVFTEKTGWINNIIYFDGANWKLMDPTFAASSNQSAETMKFIGDGKNYSVVYTY